MKPNIEYAFGNYNIIMTVNKYIHIWSYQSAESVW